MANNLIPVGFKDDVTSDVTTEHIFKNKIIDYFCSNGFDLVKTPLIEYFDKDMSKNVFTISVKKNEEKLNIRSDITLQVASLSKTRLSKKNKPLKLCYYGEVARKKGSMLRPERQFLQIGAECIGEKNILADVEMMELAYTSLSLVGIKNIIIEISSRVFFDKFIFSIKKSSQKNEILRLIRIKDLNGILKILNKKNSQYIVDLFSCTGTYKDKKKFLKKLRIDTDTSNEIFNIEKIISIFLSRNKGAKIFLDLCEIADNHYHSGMRFTFFAENVRGEIARGGRYQFKNMSRTDVGTGFTCYMDSILRASSSVLNKKKIIIPFDTSKNLTKELVDKGFSLFRYTGNLNITKKLALHQNCQFYLSNNNVKKIIK